ncbi:MAG: PBP1A family penicillin-binding protein [Pseudomonadota bacterium]
MSDDIENQGHGRDGETPADQQDGSAIRPERQTRAIGNSEKGEAVLAALAKRSADGETSPNKIRRKDGTAPSPALRASRTKNATKTQAGFSRHIERLRSLFPDPKTQRRTNRRNRRRPDGPPPSEAEKYTSAARSQPFWLNLAGGMAASLISVSAIAGAGVLFFAFVVMAPRIPEGADLWNVNRPAAVIVLDRNSEEIASRGARYGESVSTEELPDHLVNAFLATEDRRFYDHGGVDIRGTIRAAVTNMRSGRVVQGGSTITQQLAKNLFLSPEQTYTRKLREALLALWLEGRHDKDEILSLYLNRIYLGAGAYGIESAAQTYFGKSARDLSLSESVLLAGLPKAPSSLAPTQNPQGAKARADEVLDNLLEIGEVTPFEAREARQNPPILAKSAAETGLGYFFDYVSAKANALARESGRVQGGDLVVETTIDQKLQRDAEAAVAAALTVENRMKGADQAALVAYDNSGGLRAMVGGRSYKDSQFNRATQAERQPGSAFKPFVFVAALESGLTPSSRFVDQPIDIDGWQPTNYKEEYVGPVRLTEAIAKSINTVAVQVTEEVGRQKVADAARRLGVKADVPPLRSIALGAVDVTLDDLTGAYLPLANAGVKPEPFVITRIEDSDRNLIYEREKSSPVRVMAPQTAKDMNHLLYQVMHSGTGARARLGKRQAVGKTGTTNDWRDAWFVGYTGQLTTGVWVGNDDYTPMEKITGGTIPASIWRDFMLAAHQNQPLLPLDGAYPAVTYTSESSLLSFYSDVSRGFARVRRDGNEDRRRKRRR